MAVSVPSSTSVPSSINRGVPVVQDKPKEPVSAAIRSIADVHIRGRFGAPVEETARRGLFRRSR